MRILFVALLLALQQAPLSTSEEDAFKELPPMQVHEKSGSADDQARAARERMNQQVGDAQDRQLEELEQISARVEAQYAALQERMAAQREQFRAGVAKKWGADDVQESTEKTWVDYSDDSGSRSKVDFDKGEVEVEVLVPADDVAKGKPPEQFDAKDTARLKALAEKKLEAQTQRMLAQKEEPPAQERAEPQAAAPAQSAPAHSAPTQSEPVLQGQLRRASGKPVTQEDARKFVREELAPKMVVEKKPVVAEDGKKQIRVKVTVALAPDHLKVRADRYKSQVEAQAKKLGVDPSLIYAVIHTESSFNPLAHSGAGAFGLMQLIPKAAAREAYKHLNKGEEKVLTPEYLYDAGNNITLGATYLQLLQNAYFGKLRSLETRQVLSIAAYNCGPTRVKKTVIRGNDVDSMTPGQVVALVQKKAPDETKVYVERVRERMAMWR
jgi:membrane-bound lytic murein transglycosylase C